MPLWMSACSSWLRGWSSAILHCAGRLLFLTIKHDFFKLEAEHKSVS